MKSGVRTIGGWGVPMTTEISATVSTIRHFFGKKRQNRDFEGSIGKNEGTEIQNFFFIELVLLSTQTW